MKSRLQIFPFLGRSPIGLKSHRQGGGYSGASYIVFGKASAGHSCLLQRVFHVLLESDSPLQVPAQTSSLCREAVTSVAKVPSD
jgi:hypothetical protein